MVFFSIGENKIIIFGHKNFIKLYLAFAVMLLCSVSSGKAFAYETVEAVTVIPENTLNKEEHKAVSTNRYYDSSVAGNR